MKEIFLNLPKPYKGILIFLSLALILGLLGFILTIVLTQKFSLLGFIIGLIGMLVYSVIFSLVLNILFFIIAYYHYKFWQSNPKLIHIIIFCITFFIGLLNIIDNILFFTFII